LNSAEGSKPSTRERDFHAEQVCAEDPRVGHVAGRVAEERNLAAAQRTHEVTSLRPALGHGEGIGINLAGMQKISERVDHRHRTGAREFLHFGVLVSADDQAVHKARQHLGRVGNRFAAPSWISFLFRNSGLPPSS
jgi:hypothetical protein